MQTSLSFQTNVCLLMIFFHKSNCDRINERAEPLKYFFSCNSNCNRVRGFSSLDILIFLCARSKSTQTINCSFHFDNLRHRLTCGGWKDWSVICAEVSPSSDTIMSSARRCKLWSATCVEDNSSLDTVNSNVGSDSWWRTPSSLGSTCLRKWPTEMQNRSKF